MPKPSIESENNFWQGTIPFFFVLLFAFFGGGAGLRFIVMQFIIVLELHSWVSRTWSNRQTVIMKER